MYIKFSELENVKKLNISFDKNNPPKEFNISDTAIRNKLLTEGVEFDKKDCSDLKNILITSGHGLEVLPEYNSSMNFYFKRTTPDTYIVNIDVFSNWIENMRPNTPETAYSVKVNGINGDLEKINQLAQILAEAPENFYVDLSPTNLTHETWDIQDTRKDLFAEGSRPFPKCFKDILNITGISIPITDNHIRERTFEGCINLKHLYLESESFDGWTLWGTLPILSDEYTIDDLKNYYYNDIGEEPDFKGLTSGIYFNSKSFADNNIPCIDSPEIFAEYAAGIYSISNPGFKAWS